MTLFKALKKGGKIRRKCWHESAYIEIYNDFDHSLNFLKSDIMATDWEEYKNEKTI